MSAIWRTAISSPWRWVVAVLGCALLLAACGGGADRTKARVRLVNASAYAGLDLTVDDTRRFSTVAYGGSAEFVEVSPSNTVSSISSAGSATSLLSFTPSLAKDKAYSVLAYGAQGSLAQVLLDENSNEPDTGKTLLRVVNAAPDAGSLDVYVTASGDALTTSVPLQSAAAKGSVGSYSTVNSATWRVRVTAAGSKDDLRLDLPAVVLASKQVLTPGSGGVLVNALLITQEGAIARLDNSQTRVRVAAAVTDSGTVAATVGGVTLRSGLGAPFVSLYSLVPAGSAAVSVAVNAVPSASTTTLAAGADYTLLVHGTPAAPRLSWLQDDNRLATSSSAARLRLVHALADLTAPLSLTSNFQPVADNVAQGAASTATSLEGTTKASLSVTALGVALPVFSAIEQELKSGAVYSLFVVGKSAAAVGVLVQDR
jgi:hypothetical protein